MSLLHIMILTPFVWAVLAPLLSMLLRRVHAGWLVLPGPVALFACFISRVPAIMRGESLSASLSWLPSLGIDFTVYLDGLGMLFALLITGMGSLVVLYSICYMHKTQEALRNFYVYLLLFMGAMLGVVLSDNVMVLYGFWELTSISSFLLIAFWHRRERSRYGAQKSLLITVFGGLAMFAGFLLLYAITGTFHIRDMMGQAGAIASHSLFFPAMLLILLGAFTKSAQFPFHIWLPDAMEAPTPVSAYLHSATMVKAGLYLVARFTPAFAGRAEWFWLVSGVGLATLIYGSCRAIRQTDLKAMLAYSTISQLGLMMCLLGLGSAAFAPGAADPMVYAMATAAALFHLLNHAMFKGTLFMVAGIIDHETGTRDIRRLGGLAAVMPATFTFAMIGALSMAGLPPFSGFLSKEMFFASVLAVRDLGLWSTASLGVWFPVVAWTASVFTFVYCAVLLLKPFTGKLKVNELDKRPHEAPLLMLVPPAILALGVVGFGLFPNLLSRWLLEPAMASMLQGLPAEGEAFALHIAFWHGFTPELFMTLGVAVAGMTVYGLLRRFQLLRPAGSGRISLNRLYDWGLRALEQCSRRLTEGYMTGSVRHYLIYIFLFLMAASGFAMLQSGTIRFGASSYAPVSVYEVLIVAVMLVAAVAVALARTRLTAILFTGAVGYMVTLLFVLFRAPDLALTQMIVETVSVTLFLLCFYFLPKWKKERWVNRFRWSNLLISAGVGAVVTLVALGVLGAGDALAFQPISEFFIRGSYELAGGKNVVNVILVDFRGFDTMLEIVVLAIASLGIYAMIRLRKEPEHPSMQSVSAEASGRFNRTRSNDVILRTASRAIVFMITAFSIALFLSGHNNPGGGFIGALTASAALLLLSISFGPDMVSRVLPVNFRKLTAAGLLTAFLTGFGSLLFRVPFLTHSFGYFHLPLLGETELATAVLFDLGVYLAVIGVAMTIIFTIGRDSRPWNS